MADPIAALKDIAKQSRKVVRTLTLIDPKVCKSLRDYFHHQLSIECKGRNVRLHANPDFIVCQISGSFAIDAFSINRRDIGKSQVPWLPDKRGGLNGSMQHLLKFFLQESTRLVPFAGVNSNKT
jgi:hypothetical protein